MPVADNSATFTQLANAIHKALRIGTGLPESKIVLYQGEYMPRTIAEQFIQYRFIEDDFFSDSGAGRLQQPATLTLDVTLYTRLALDQAGRDYIYLTDASLGHYATQFKIHNTLMSIFLFTGEPDIPGLSDPTGDKLTNSPIRRVPSGKVKKDLKDPTWGSSTMLYEIDIIMPYTYRV